VRVADENIILEAGQIGHNRYPELGGVEVQQGQISRGRIASTFVGYNSGGRLSGINQNNRAEQSGRIYVAVTKATVEKFNILQFVAVEAQSNKCGAIRRLEIVFVAHMTRRLTESQP
jgi:hypothetical protein